MKHFLSGIDLSSDTPSDFNEIIKVLNEKLNRRRLDISNKWFYPPAGNGNIYQLEEFSSAAFLEMPLFLTCSWFRMYVLYMAQNVVVSLYDLAVMILQQSCRMPKKTCNLQLTDFSLQQNAQIIIFLCS